MDSMQFPSAGDLATQPATQVALGSVTRELEELKSSANNVNGLTQKLAKRLEGILSKGKSIETKGLEPENSLIQTPLVLKIREISSITNKTKAILNILLENLDL